MTILQFLSMRTVPTNNFNLLRIVFAVLVVITHSYNISGDTLDDYLTRLTYGQVSFSFIGLSGFFIISGYLVFQSLMRSESVVSYFKKRILRIFPALFIVLLLTVLLGYFVYESDFHSYVTNASVWTYLPRNFFLRNQDIIQGIFTKNPYGPIINESLWSLLYEFSFYVALAVLFFFTRRVQIILTLLVLILLLIGRLFWYTELSEIKFILEARLVLEYGPFFAFGSLLAILKIENITWNKSLLVLLVFLLIIAVVVQIFDLTRFFLLPSIVILIGLESIPFLNKVLAKLGDVSYGIYIYAFPAQQTLIHYFRFTTMELIVTSIIVSFMLGYFSWHCIEKYALKLKSN